MKPTSVDFAVTIAAILVVLFAGIGLFVNAGKDRTTIISYVDCTGQNLTAPNSSLTLISVKYDCLKFCAGRYLSSDSYMTERCIDHCEELGS